VALDINHYACPHCGREVEPWLARRPRFRCASCGRDYCSNYQHSLKRSALAGLLLWLGGVLLGLVLIQPWQMVLAVALKLALLFFVPGSVWTIIDRNNNRKPPRGAGK